MDSATAGSYSCDGLGYEANVELSDSDSTVLNEGKAIQASQAPDERVTYDFAAKQGEIYLVQVVQEQLDFAVAIEFPDGSRRVFNSPLRRDSDEFILIEEKMGGFHRISVFSDEYTGTVGSHSIRISNIDASSDPRVEILRNISSGAESYPGAGEEKANRARIAYRSAAVLAEAEGFDELRAYSLYASAMIEYQRFNAWQEAADLAQQAASLFEELNEPDLMAAAFAWQAAAMIEASNSTENLTDALALFEMAAATQAQYGRNFDLAHTVNNIGLTYFYMGDLKNARNSWQQAASMFGNQKELSGEILAIGNLGSVDLDEGYLTSAVNAFERVLDLERPGVNLHHRVDVLSNLALANRLLNDFDRALAGFSCARLIAEQIDYSWGLAWALAGIGETYYAMGELALAAEYLRAALPATRLTGDSRGQAVVLRYLGSIERSQGDYRSALDSHQQALEIVGAALDRVLAQLDVARDLSALEMHDDAIELLADALGTARKSGSRLLFAETQLAMGSVLSGAGKHKEALIVLKQAAEDFAALGMVVERARAMHAMASSAVAAGRLERAIEYGNVSLHLIEAVRGSVSDPELRAFYLSARRDYYELQIDLLMRRHREAGDATTGFVAAALAAGERSRARLTLDLLQRGVIRTGASDPDVNRRRSELYRSLAEQRYQRDKLIRSTSDESADDGLTSLIPAIADTENELNLLEAGLRSSGDNEEGKSDVTLSLGEMQAALDADSVLLQYALGAKRSFVWVVTRDGITSAELARREVIEDVARQVFDDLRGFALTRAAKAEEAARRQELSDLVITPIRQYLHNKRLIIAADGALQYIPFGVLPVRGNDEARQPLNERHEIVGVPSLSVVAAQRQRNPLRQPSKTAVVFADPVFDRKDARLPDAGERSTDPSGDHAKILTLAELRTEAPLTRLPWTAREAAAIQSLLAEEDRSVLIGFGANLEAIDSIDLGDYRILHFATHGLIDTAHPDLSTLVLSQFDSSGLPRNGYLELHDIYDLDLTAQLVVLSACETALGREIRAEGLLGLTQGFMTAGARSVIATLWPVSDQTTSELMAVFYETLLKSDATPAEALRRAQMRIASQDRWSDPYFWGAFVLIGDWR